ncbi:MAG TPA: alpha/beta fold hydrolase [Nocardioides sp.]|nr:alpha/beta fold hydrolase [Nocardioides sp.]
MSTPMDRRITSYYRDGLTFDVRDEGPLDGRVAVLLHGFPERGSSWRDVAPVLHSRGIRTLAPDQRGYSPGARPRRRRDYRVPLLVDDVTALVERTGGPVDVVGHDWGAIVGWGLASTRPDLVRTLTAVSVPHPGAFLRAMLTSDQGVKSRYMLVFQLPFLPERWARQAGGRFDREFRNGGMTADDVARFRREIVDYGALPGGLAWYRAMFLTDPRATRGRVPVPTTYVWSDRDVAVTRHAAELCGRYVTGPYRFAVLEGVTHWIPTQAPEPLAALILARILG